MGGILLVNIRTRNVLGVYDTEEQALEDVARGIRHHGDPKSARNLQIQRLFDDRPDEPIARGEELIRRALDRFPERQSA